MSRRPARSEQIARVLAIGDELMLGRTVDTNSAALARLLGEHGLRVQRLQCVGDRQDEIEQALRSAAERCRLLVCTGGLGPTEDDRTRHALAAVLGEELVERPAAWRLILAAFAKLRPGLPVPPSNRRQALFPPSADVLPNDRGTAPGLLARVDGCWIACLPGVPHEMDAMALRLARRLPQLLPGLRVPAVGECWLGNIGESSAQERIGGLLSESDPQVGITASELGHLTLRAVGTRAAVAARMRALRTRLRPWLLPAPGFAASLVGLLGRRGWTIAAAESCTVGHVAAMLGAVPGASTVLRRSAVAYHADDKRALLGVDAGLIRREGVVSEAVALAMARGCRRWARADVAVATTGVAGPGGGTPAAPVGTVWIAAAVGRRAVAKRLHLRGSRQRIQQRAAGMALGLAWELASAHP